ncbi:ATP-grasp fold amidoligase family protein [Clostridium perfringens]|uniref:ATP-grasp fold amidoligase family protein n=1 Tax=Clostridium perfringens TaxID=1502 RepID=UPI0024BD1338|nr:ATP-grasp fold amidoligase family protein [Clostridium perfringens]MDM0686134.1 ATP-grasp fold amidoligase family protein [Clostridium perfringens]
MNIKKNKLIKKGYDFFKVGLIKISPVLATKLMFRVSMGKTLNLKNPLTFNEKLQWLKLYWNDSIKSKCADKYEVRDYITSLGCNEILNEVYYVYDSVDEISWDKLPNKFALKCTHGSGTNIICSNKNELNEIEVKKLLNKWMKIKYSKIAGEIHYDYIKPRIICEKYIENKNGFLPDDYKFYSFNGNVDLVMVCTNREYGKARYYFFDQNWNLVRCNNDGINAPNNFTLPKPLNLDKMFDYARLLSNEFPFVRVDLYNNDGKIIFGELTFTPAGCLDSSMPKSMDIDFGNRINLDLWRKDNV